MRDGLRGHVPDFASLIRATSLDGKMPPIALTHGA
jgi:hypothetical protein